jgi:hypothetical protein
MWNLKGCLLTDLVKDRTLGHMIRALFIVSLSLWLTSCAPKAPVQAMAEARAAVQSVRVLYANDEAKASSTYRHYQSAEQSLMDASKALDAKKFTEAKQKAHQAKRQARLAAKLK